MIRNVLLVSCLAALCACNANNASSGDGGPGASADIPTFSPDSGEDRSADGSDIEDADPRQDAAADTVEDPAEPDADLPGPDLPGPDLPVTDADSGDPDVPVDTIEDTGRDADIAPAD